MPEHHLLQVDCITVVSTCTEEEAHLYSQESQNVTVGWGGDNRIVMADS